MRLRVIVVVAKAKIGAGPTPRLSPSDLAVFENAVALDLDLGSPNGVVDRLGAATVLTPNDDLFGHARPLLDDRFFRTLGHLDDALGDGAGGRVRARHRLAAVGRKGLLPPVALGVDPLVH